MAKTIQNCNHQPMAMIYGTWSLEMLIDRVIVWIVCVDLNPHAIPLMGIKERNDGNRKN